MYDRLNPHPSLLIHLFQTNLLIEIEQRQNHFRFLVNQPVILFIYDILSNSQIELFDLLIYSSTVIIFSLTLLIIIVLNLIKVKK